jgi:hypothetical protein
MVTKVNLDQPRQVFPDSEAVTTRVAFRLADGTERLFRELTVGAMWNDEERGLCVKLPGCTHGNIWALKEKPTDGGNGWTWTGEAPNITATPSINFVGIYHGWVQNGMVTDDCEGRKFDDLGKRLN